MKQVLGIIALGVLLSGCESEIWQRMRAQPKFKPYAENKLFEDGRAMRTPPEGTVSREARERTDAPSSWQENGNYRTRIPVTVTRELLLRGKKKFEITCATCHGLLGNGHSLVADNMGTRPPPSMFAEQRTPGAYFEVITLGRGLMPSFAYQLPVQDRWAVVAYVLALRKSQNSRLEDVPADERRSLMEATR